MNTKRFLVCLLTLCAAIFLIALAGCEGSDAKKAVTDAVKAAVGSEVAKKSQEMKDQIGRAVDQEAKRLTKMDNQKKGDPSEKGQESTENESEE
ncbi:MAG: hypothetical protein ABFD70_13850 [Syntrophaceae bacterium]|nr:hypothetical protein [Deltaproteobacteria bacterium]